MAKVFVSYASADRAKVAKLAGALEKRGHEVWWDHHLMPGEDYRDRIEQALAGADAVIVAWSAASIHSDWVQSEADDARKSGKLAPATLDGTLPPKPFDRLHTESLKGWSGGARDHRFAKLAESVEAIAEGRAARPVKYRRPLLTWGGVSAGAVAALALVANIGTVRDLFAPPPATVEDVETLRGEIEALRLAVAQQTAPENGEVDPQRAAEREAAIRDVVDEEPDAARLIAAGDLGAGLDALAESAEADARNAARKWREIGQLAYDREPTRALEAYRRATALDGSDFWSWIYLSRLERRHAGQLAPARAAAQRALEVAGDERARSVAYFEVADIAVAAGDLTEARQNFEVGTEILRALSAADPSSAAARRDVMISVERLGDVARAEGDLAGAKAFYEERMEISRALSAADPSSAAARRDVYASQVKLGDVAVAEGDLGAAKAAYGEGLELRRALSAADLSSAAARRDVSVSLDRLGDVAVAEGDLGAAKAAYGEGLELARALSAADLSSAAARRDVSVSLDRLGDVAVAEGDLGAAKAAYGEGLELRRALSAADPASAAARRDVIVSLAKLAQLTGDAGYWREALPVVEEMAAKGQLAPVDAWMLDRIRAEAAE